MPDRPASAFIRDARLSPTRPISVLTFSTLYPNREMPYLGIFVESRLRGLLRSGEAASMVVAPVPWFPFDKPMFGRYGAFARVPREELRHGIPVLHPRYPLLPKLGMSSAPFLMYAGLRNALAKILKGRFGFDLIDAHYVYPDGVAAVLLGRSLGKPVVITARGTDINLISHYRLAKRWIRWAAQRADGIVAVSDALRDRLIELGVPGSRIVVLRNGVDLELFAPQDRAAARRELGLGAEGPIVLSVSSLVPLKGVDLVIRAVAALRDASLVVVGEGPEASALRGWLRRCSCASGCGFWLRCPSNDWPPCTMPPTSWCLHRPGRAVRTFFSRRSPAVPRSSPQQSGECRKSCARALRGEWWQSARPRRWPAPYAISWPTRPRARPCAPTRSVSTGGPRPPVRSGCSGRFSADQTDTQARLPGRPGREGYFQPRCFCYDRSWR